MKTLEFGTDNAFTFLCKTRKGEQSEVGYLWKCDKGQIFILKAPVVIQAVYTAADHAEIERLEYMEPIRNGDTVLVDDTRHAVTIRGNFADAGMLTPL